MSVSLRTTKNLCVLLKIPVSKELVGGYGLLHLHLPMVHRILWIALLYFNLLWEKDKLVPGTISEFY